jgi:hypothetical protein
VKEARHYHTENVSDNNSVKTEQDATSNTKQNGEDRSHDSQIHEMHLPSCECWLGVRDCIDAHDRKDEKQKQERRPEIAILAHPCSDQWSRD